MCFCICTSYWKSSIMLCVHVNEKFRFFFPKEGEINQSFSLLIVMILAGRLFQSFSNINNHRLKSTCHICITLPVLHVICNSLDKSINSVCRFPLSGLRFCSFAGRIWTWWYNFLYIFVQNCQTIKMRCHTTLSNMYVLFSYKEY